MTEALPWSLAELDAELARRSLAEFVCQSWHVIEPGTPLVWGWAVEAICDHVQALIEDRLGFQNLDINVPPGSMKSTIVSVCLPAWVWIQDPKKKTGLGPGWRVICTSGSDEIAQRDSLRCRDIVVSDWYREAFRPTWGLTKDQNTKHLFKNTVGGWRRAMSAGARITGTRGDCIVVDDPNDAQEAYSQPARDQIITWWDQGAVNRLNNLAKDKRIIIQQRLHEQDLTGYVLKKNRKIWDCLVIRQEYEKPRATDPDFQPTGLGWVDPRTVEGGLFFPERFPPKVVEEEKVAKGSSGYAGQHQQRPAPAEGAIFKKGPGGAPLFRWYNPAAMPRFARIVTSGDTAFKEKEENDYSVIFAAGECTEPGRAGIYLLDRWKERTGYPGLKAKAKTMSEKWRPTAFLIEDKASGQSLIQELKADTTIPVVAVKVDTDKVSRAHTCVPAWEAGTIYLPEGADWVDDFLEQLYGFPKLAHDDDVDAFTQLVRYLILGGGSTGMLEWMRREALAIQIKEAYPKGLFYIRARNGGAQWDEFVEEHGEIGQALLDEMVANGHVTLMAGGGVVLTDAGAGQ